MLVFPMLYKKLFKTPEGKILIVGIGMLVFLAFFLGLLPLLEIGNIQTYIGMLTTNIVLGRAAGLLFGFTTDLPFVIVTLFTFFVEAIMVMIIYPLFILSMKQLVKIKSMEYYFDRLHSSANKYRGITKKYGAIALFIFVWIPFWMTGPIVGCIIGYFLGFSHIKTILLVLSSTLTAIIGWALLLHKLGKQLSYISTELSIFLFITIVFILLFFWLKRKN